MRIGKMAKQANRLMIGGFVVLAVVIMAASLVVFGSGKFFKKTSDYVLHFDGSIKGLNVGSPVLFQGVPIGAVKNIVLRADTGKQKVEIPVYISTDPDKITVRSDEVPTSGDRVKNLRSLIEKGMRATLAMQSFITGQLMIELDFHPGTPVNLTGVDKNYLEIPTIPSTTARLSKSLAKLNLTELQGYLQSALSGIDQLANNEDLKQSLHILRGILSDARQLVQHVDGKVDPLTENINGTIGDARNLLRGVDSQVKPLTNNANATLNEYRKLASDANRKVDLLSKSAIAAMDGARSALKSIDGLVGKDSATRADLDTMLQELAGAARSLRILADYLEQHPDALLRGKGYRKY
jgi:paraquat-inducible protein B